MRIAIVALACWSCSSHYMPRARGRVAVMIKDGQQAYVRDGVYYEQGLLGGGLERAVAGNHAAEAAASEFHDRLRDGLVALFVGAAATIAGTAYGTADALSDPNRPRAFVAPLAITLVGVVVMMIGAGHAVSAEPYRWDAINLFNDGGEPPELSPPGFAAHRAPAATTASLHMR